MSKTDWQLRQDLCTTENKYYRIVPNYDNYGEDMLEVEVYVGVKKTPKGMWIIRKDWVDYVDQKWVKKRFILDSSKKKYAYPTVEGAVDGFIKRKERQIKILSSQLADAENQLELIRDPSNIIYLTQ